MKIADLIRNLHILEIRTRKKLQGGLSSSYRNVFRGQGLEFSEVREYVAGDDIRLVDWNVTARLGSLHVKQLLEERELNVVTAVQCSRSMDFGTGEKTKFETAAEIASTLIFSAIHAGDRPGIVTFSEGGRLDYIPPGKGMDHAFRLLHRLISSRPDGRAPGAGDLLNFLTHGLKKRSVVFLISDFIYSDWRSELIETAARRHDFTAIAVLDAAEIEGPPRGVFPLEGEGRGPTFVGVSRRVREAYASRIRDRLAGIRSLLAGAGVDYLAIRAGASCEEDLHKLFLRRRQSHMPA